MNDKNIRISNEAHEALEKYCKKDSKPKVIMQDLASVAILEKIDRETKKKKK